MEKEDLKAELFIALKQLKQLKDLLEEQPSNMDLDIALEGLQNTIRGIRGYLDWWS